MSYLTTRANVTIRPMRADEVMLVHTCETPGCIRPAEVWVDYDLIIRSTAGEKQRPSLGRGCCRPCADAMVCQPARAPGLESR